MAKKVEVVADKKEAEEPPAVEMTATDEATVKPTEPEATKADEPTTAADETTKADEPTKADEEMAEADEPAKAEEPKTDEEMTPAEDPAPTEEPAVAKTAAEEPTTVAAVEEPTGMQPGDRDVVIGEGSGDQKTNLLLQDVIRLHRVVFSLKLNDDKDVKDEEINKLVDRLIKLIKKGKDYELAGWKEVPRSFMKSAGRFLEKEGDSWKELSDKEAKESLTKIVTAEFEGDLQKMTESPYKEFKEILLRKSTTEAIGAPEAKDVILLHCEGPETDKIFDQQSSNKAIFNLASQLVTSFTSSPEKRVEAAFMILQGIDEAEIMEDAPSNKDAPASAPTSKVARFLVRASGGDGTTASAVWSVLDTVDAIEFVTTFVFEVYLEKEIHVSAAVIAAAEKISGGVDTSKPGTEPVPEPTDIDVLFGRGGMTNSHVGNRRFRDIITLHRPDYIRAIKMDKPGVARKIVKAIRLGSPPGRFLKKGDDGKWYDVGDRIAAEKTSQGLRERSNNEKRHRSALREALRIRKEDMPDDDGSPATKKAKLGEAGANGDGETATMQLNYNGTNLAIPLSLSMKEASKAPAKKKVAKDGKEGESELNTEGLPPNATDEDGNILVTDYDILCGRGGLTNHHKGNKRFRDVVALHRPDYVRAPKIQKPSVARVIVRAIRNGDPPGRFLRKDDKSGKWVDVGDKKAAEKTSQALREKTNEERDNMKEQPTTLGVLLPNPASFMAAATAAMIPVAVATAAMIPATSPLTSSKKAEDKAKTDDDEAKADEKEEKADGTADDEAGEKMEVEKTDDKEKKADDDKDKEEAKEEKEPISADGDTAMV